MYFETSQVDKPPAIMGQASVSPFGDEVVREIRHCRPEWKVVEALSLERLGSVCKDK